MKRLVLLALLAALCLGLLATPAFAAKKTDHYRPPEGVPMLAIFGGGWWWDYHEATGDPNLDLAGWQASAMPPTGDADLDGAWKPLPLGSVVYATYGWINTTYGQTNDLPRALAITVDVAGPEGFSQHFSPAEVQTMWTGAYEFDEWWQTFAGGPAVLFNPKIMAGAYINRPMVPLGPFQDSGWYHISISQDQVLPIIDHFFYDFDGDGMADRRGATRWPVGSNSWVIEFDFYVE